MPAEATVQRNAGDQQGPRHRNTRKEARLRLYLTLSEAVVLNKVLNQALVDYYTELTPIERERAESVRAKLAEEPPEQGRPVHNDT